MLERQNHIYDLLKINHCIYFFYFFLAFVFISSQNFKVFEKATVHNKSILLQS